MEAGLSGRPVSLILADAIRETEACEQRLAEVLEQTRQALQRAETEQKEAKEARVGLQKLHAKATRSVRRREDRALGGLEAQSRQLVGPRPKEVIRQCLSESLEMLTKEQIQEQTGLSPKSVGVVCGHGVRSGDFIEREGLFGLASSIDRELAAIRRGV